MCVGLERNCYNYWCVFLFVSLLNVKDKIEYNWILIVIYFIQQIVTAICNVFKYFVAYICCSQMCLLYSINYMCVCALWYFLYNSNIFICILQKIKENNVTSRRMDDLCVDNGNSTNAVNDKLLSPKVDLIANGGITNVRLLSS